MNPPQIITLLTVLTFFIGALSVYCIRVMPTAHSVLASTLLAGLTIGISWAVPKFNHMSRLSLLKCLATTHVFGLVDCCCLAQLASE